MGSQADSSHGPEAEEGEGGRGRTCAIEEIDLANFNQHVVAIRSSLRQMVRKCTIDDDEVFHLARSFAAALFNENTFVMRKLLFVKYGYATIVEDIPERDILKKMDDFSFWYRLCWDNDVTSRQWSMQESHVVLSNTQLAHLFRLLLAYNICVLSQSHLPPLHDPSAFEDERLKALHLLIDTYFT